MGSSSFSLLPNTASKSGFLSTSVSTMAVPLVSWRRNTILCSLSEVLTVDTLTGTGKRSVPGGAAPSENV